MSEDEQRGQRRRGSGARDFRVIAERFKPGSTRRAAVLAVVVCALALTLAVPLRTYLSQRAQISQQQQLHQQLSHQLHTLQRRQAQLADPEQIRIEARKRLLYVMPGHTPYVVELSGQQAPPAAAGTTAPPARHGHGAWYDRLWQSMDRAGK